MLANRVYCPRVSNDYLNRILVRCEYTKYLVKREEHGSSRVRLHYDAHQTSIAVSIIGGCRGTQATQESGESKMPDVWPA
jgi:hypothetical protein